MKKAAFFLFQLLIVIGLCHAQVEKVLQDQPNKKNPPKNTISLLQEKLGYGSTDCPSWRDLVVAKSFLDTAPDIRDGTKKTDQLVSNYAFRKLIKTNFNNLILGNEDHSKISRYATLDLSDHPSFSFTPYYFESDPKYEYYKNILSTTIAGKLNDEDFFNLSDWRDLSASVSYIRLLNHTNYQTIKKPSALKKKMTCNIQPLIKEIFDDYEKKFAKLCSSESCVESKEELKDEKNKLIDDLVEAYTEAEIKVAEDFWKNKNFLWLKADLKFLAIDRIKFLSTNRLLSGDYDPEEKIVYIPTLSLALNYLTKGNKKDNSLLLTGWVSLQKKHGLSEVFSPDEFQPFHSVHDSLLQLKSKEEVFITSFNEVGNKITLDYGFRTVVMGDISSADRPRQIGLSLSFSRSGLVNDAKYPSLFKTELGGVFPFLGKDGESEFNLELFYRWKIFSDFPNENERGFGIRFNIPINNN